MGERVRIGECECVKIKGKKGRVMKCWKMV